MRERRKTGLFTLIFFVAVAGKLYAADLTAAIIGKWSPIKPGEEKAEFIKGGTVILGEKVCDYSWLDGERIRINYPPPIPARMCNVKIEYGVLTLGCQDKTFHHYFVLPEADRIVNSTYAKGRPPFALDEYYPMATGTEREYRYYYSKSLLRRDDEVGYLPSKSKVFPAKEVPWLPSNHYAFGQKLIRVAQLECVNNSCSEFDDKKIREVSYYLSQPDAIRYCALDMRLGDKRDIDSQHKDEDLRRWIFPNGSYLMKSPVQVGKSWKEGKKATKNNVVDSNEISPGVYPTDFAEVTIESIDDKVATPMGWFVNCIRVAVKHPKDDWQSKVWFAPGFGEVKAEGQYGSRFLVKTSIR